MLPHQPCAIVESRFQLCAKDAYPKSIEVYTFPQSNDLDELNHNVGFTGIHNFTFNLRKIVLRARLFLFEM